MKNLTKNELVSFFGGVQGGGLRNVPLPSGSLPEEMEIVTGYPGDVLYVYSVGGKEEWAEFGPPDGYEGPFQAPFRVK